MTKNQIIEELKQKCKFFLNENIEKADSKKIKLYTNILNILNSENFFNKLDAEITLNILTDLEVSQEKALQTYIQLISWRVKI